MSQIQKKPIKQCNRQRMAKFCKLQCIECIWEQKKDRYEGKSCKVIYTLIYYMLNANNEEHCKKILEKTHYQTMRKIGKGGYGHVVLASKFSNAVHLYAIKCISLKNSAKDPHLKRYISQQTKAMCAIDHPNVVRLENSFADSGWHFLVMEYCDMGNLHDYQRKINKKTFNFSESCRILSQILNGTLAIHSRNIMHRDLKSENIFLLRNKNNSYTCKIGDFGFAKVVENTAKTTCGTVFYMAPQVMSNLPYSFQADLWSIGVIFYQMLFGDHPFKSINIEKQIMDKCANGFTLPSIPQQIKNRKQEQQLKDFFKRVFEIDPKKRITLYQMLNHPLLHTLKENDTSADSTDDLEEVQWQLQKVRFIQKVFDDVEQQKLLQTHLIRALRFYLIKVMRIFLTQPQIQNYVKQQPKSQISKKINQRLFWYNKQIKVELEKVNGYKNELKKIERFSDGLNIEIQNFSEIKQGYRNTVGKAFEKVHQGVSDEKTKAQLKFRIFCCHLINRVFNSGMKEDLFKNFCEWKKQNNKKAKKRDLQFDLLAEWVGKQSPQKILSEIQNINRRFYQRN